MNLTQTWPGKVPDSALQAAWAVSEVSVPQCATRQRGARDSDLRTLPPGVEWKFSSMEILGVENKFLLAKLGNHGWLKFRLIGKSVTEAVNSDGHVNTTIVINNNGKDSISATTVIA